MTSAQARHLPVIGITVEPVGTRGAPVDLHDGRCTADRVRLLTPSPATPDVVAGVVGTVVELLCRPGPIGITVPAAVRNGVVETVMGLDPQWIGVNAVDLFARTTGGVVTVVNDIDAAGVAEMRFGAGKDRSGVVVVITLDSRTDSGGIGSALFVDGRLEPNSELGMLAPREDVGDWSVESLRDELSWLHFAHRLQSYLDLVERLLWPNLIILAGRVSTKTDQFLPHLSLRTELVPASLRQDASMVGAALLASCLRTPLTAGSHRISPQ